MSNDWTDQENDLVVADYFAMLADDIAGRPYNKAEHNRHLQTQIGRTSGSIEFKHQNVSAVLKALGEEWISGYKPAFNFQMSLVDAVIRWFSSNRVWLERGRVLRAASQMSEPGLLWVGPPPTLSNQPLPDELEQTLRVARKYDVAGRDERNRVLGKAGEKLVFDRERAILTGAGRGDLARRISWVSDEEGDGAGYDIASFETNGAQRLIEVKTTNGWERTPFYISRNELACADERRSEWCLFRLYNFSSDPQAFELRPPLDAHVTLTPTTFQGSFD